ncbi:DUF5691 domain-containing protein [Chitinophaga varians]|uniref:DUF5691 domain-containing protein n=1 Tax=Chitinophaga varians TaxID=2202339 RepID=UPI00165F0A14|nr:DUF5691 domain-containing protein [Chitinophaga varians]MBC9914736.1 hypothetical protein [Chitinophaga varians]
MQSWNDMINIALLGTAKKQLDTGSLPAPLQAAAGMVLAAPDTDREDQFLQLASLVFNYRQSGAMPMAADESTMTVCAPETKAYCSATAIQALQHTLDSENTPLLHLWLEQCLRNNQVLPPEYLPRILENASRHKSLRNLAAACCGKRGEWLAQFNREWNFSIAVDTTEEMWEHGTTAQRLEALTRMRGEQPAEARTLLQATWPQESAAVKAELLSALSTGISLDDAPWLESLLQEKSKQVKEASLTLLKKIPGSSLHEQYWQLLESSITVNQKGKVTVTSSIPPDAEVFKTGIDKLSNNARVSDDEYILSQLVALVHPGMWEEHLKASFEEVVDLFHHEKALKPFAPALVQAISWFADTRRALSFVQHSDTFHMTLLPLLPSDQQDTYILQHFDAHSSLVMNYVGQLQQVWSEELALKILRFCAKNPYTYSQRTMGDFITLIPSSVKSALDEISTENENYQTYWKSISMHLVGLLQIKTFIQQSFTKNS